MKYTVDTENKKITIINAKGEDIIKLAKDFKDYTFEMTYETFTSPYIPESSPYNPPFSPYCQPTITCGTNL